MKIKTYYRVLKSIQYMVAAILAMVGIMFGLVGYGFWYFSGF